MYYYFSIKGKHSQRRKGMDYNSYNNYSPAPEKHSGFGIAALILGICAFFINPLYICSDLAFIFGLIGANKPGYKKGCAIAGIITGLCALLFQLIFDFCMTFLTFGFGSVSFFC